jgi:hypothetical protein
MWKITIFYTEKAKRNFQGDKFSNWKKRLNGIWYDLWDIFSNVHLCYLYSYSDYDGSFWNLIATINFWNFESFETHSM